jgi:hypothetical protein
LKTGAHRCNPMRCGVRRRDAAARELQKKVNAQCENMVT